MVSSTGFLKLPYSRDGSAWGAVMILIAVVRRGQGPTALLTGVNHGDEYEGPIALFNLANELDLAHISGRIIIVPAMNYPAFRAGTRTSPIDKGNLNRVFPGRPSGDCYVASESAGLLEMRIDLGAAVRKGDIVARVHGYERTGLPPVEYRVKLDGILAGRHFPGLVQPGDTIAVVAVPAT